MTLRWCGRFGRCITLTGRSVRVKTGGLLGRLNQIAGIDYPEDKELQARIKSYELAFQMQRSVPETLGGENETSETRALYGIDQPQTQAFGQQCLVARRLVERGVRFVQLCHGGGGGGAWDSHGAVKQNHGRLAAQLDQPSGGLWQQLKCRGASGWISITVYRLRRSSRDRLKWLPVPLNSRDATG